MTRKTPPTRTLRQHPDLDQLKRQARELLEAFTASEPNAVAEVHAYYRGADPASFALHEAQLVLARAYGFDSWPKLKSFVDGVTVTRLGEAVRAGDVAQVRAMLKARPELVNLDMAENDEHRALHYAVLQRSPEMVRVLMDHGADARIGIYPHRDATQALTIATERGYAEIVEIIHEEEARRRPSGPTTPTLSPAPTEGVPGSEPTPRWAIATGNVDWLRARHAESRLRNPADGDGLMTTAVMANRPEVVALLLELGFDPNERTRIENLEEVVYSWGAPLQHCAGSGELAMAEMLLARGADPNGQIYASGTPVSSAYRARDAAMLALLERHGGVVAASTAGYHRDTDLARRMLAAESAGVLPSGAVSPGKTVVEELLDGDCGDPEIIRMALEHIDWPRDDPRWYPILGGPLAFWNHIPWIQSTLWPFDRTTYVECFRLILQRCHANLSGSFGRTILHDVVAMGRRDGVRDWVTEDEVLAFATTLLDAGARLDVRDDLLKSTPLGWACRWGRVTLVNLMLERDADPVETNAEPWATPTAWATSRHNDEVLAALRAHGRSHS